MGEHLLQIDLLYTYSPRRFRVIVCPHVQKRQQDGRRWREASETVKTTGKIETFRLAWKMSMRYVFFLWLLIANALNSAKRWIAATTSNFHIQMIHLDLRFQPAKSSKQSLQILPSGNRYSKNFATKNFQNDLVQEFNCRFEKSKSNSIVSFVRCSSLSFWAWNSIEIYIFSKSDLVSSSRMM